MLTVKITMPDIDNAAAMLRRTKTLLPQAMIRGIEATVLMHSRVTINAKLTEANPPYLNQRTGRLAFSVAESIKKERATLIGDRVVAAYGTNVDYGAKHERGGTFTEPVPQHQRRVTLGRNPRKVTVREHTRKRRYRARRMFAHAISDLIPYTAVPMRRSIEHLIKFGMLPSTTLLLSGTPGATPARIKRL